MMSWQLSLIASITEDRQVTIDEAMKNYSGLQDGFRFLQSQYLINQSFHDFLEQNLSHDDEEQDANGGEVIERAMDVIEKYMKNRFISIVKTAINENKMLDQSKDPLFLYAMQHKNDYMQPMVRQWVNIQDDKGRSLLHLAAWNNRRDLACMLIDAGSYLNLKDDNGKTPLHYAVSFNDVFDVASELLLAGANINTQDKNGSTPLHCAARQGNLQGVYLLTLAGADRNIENNSGKTAEQVAGSFDISAHFMQHKIMKNLGCTIS